MDTHDRIFHQALEIFKTEYQTNKIEFFTEFDLQSYLFHNCLVLLEKNKYSTPYPIRTNFGLFSPRQKIDLILGNDVVVEIKFEPDNSTIPPSRRPVVLPENVKHDLEKIHEYAEKGIPFSYFLFLDEDGQHKRRFSNLDWETLTVKDRKIYFLLHQAKN